MRYNILKYFALILFMVLFVGSAAALPPHAAFDSLPASVADAKVADSSCTWFGVASTPGGRAFVYYDSNLYACVNASTGEVEAHFIGQSDLRLTHDDFFVSLVGDTASDSKGTLTKHPTTDGTEYVMVLTPPTPFATGSEIIASVQSQVEIPDGAGGWVDYGIDVDYYIQMP